MEKKVKLRIIIAIICAILAFSILFLPNVIYFFKGQTYFLENSDYYLTPFVYGEEISLKEGEKKETEFFTLSVKSFDNSSGELNFEVKGKSKLTLGRVCYYESIVKNKIETTLLVKVKINNEYYNMDRKFAEIKRGKTVFVYKVQNNNLENLQEFSFCNIIINEYKRK